MQQTQVLRIRRPSSAFTMTEQTTGIARATGEAVFLAQQDDWSLTAWRGDRAAGLQQKQPRGEVSHFIMPGQSAQACAPSGDTSIPSVIKSRSVMSLTSIVAAKSGPFTSFLRESTQPVSA